MQKKLGLYVVLAMIMILSVVAGWCLKEFPKTAYIMSFALFLMGIMVGILLGIFRYRGTPVRDFCLKENVLFRVFRVSEPNLLIIKRWGEPTVKLLLVELEDDNEFEKIKGTYEKEDVVFIARQRLDPQSDPVWLISSELSDQFFVPTGGGLGRIMRKL